MSAPAATFLDYFQFHALTRPDEPALRLRGRQLAYSEVHHDLLRLVRFMRDAGWGHEPLPVMLCLRDAYAQVLVPMACEVLGLPYGWHGSARVQPFNGPWLASRADDVPAGATSWILDDKAWTTMAGQAVADADRFLFPAGSQDRVRWLAPCAEQSASWTISRAVVQQRLLWTVLDGQISRGDLLRLWSPASDEFMQHWIQAGLSVGACVQLLDDGHGVPEPSGIGGGARWEVLRGGSSLHWQDLWRELAAHALALGSGAQLIGTTAGHVRAAWTPASGLRPSETIRVSLANEVCGVIASRVSADGLALLVPQLHADLRPFPSDDQIARLWVSSPFVAAPAPAPGSEAPAGPQDAGLRVRSRTARLMELA